MNEGDNGPGDAMASIVIPAYNEGENITRLLRAIAPDGGHRPFEIAVVCNGCTDNTYELARRFADRVVVEELEKPSKIAALNRGDDLVSVFPRIYLDADIALTERDVALFLRQMTASGKLAGSMRIKFDTDGSPYLVQKFYQVWSRLPYLATFRSMGSGFYALSKAGRARFGRFPEVTGDDMFVDSLFTVTEKFQSQDVRMVVQAPKQLLGLIRIRSRAYAGNVELSRSGLLSHELDPGTTSALREMLRQRSTRVPALIYLAVQSVARVHAGLFRSTQRGVWLRDESTRRSSVPRVSTPGSGTNRVAGKAGFQ